MMLLSETLLFLSDWLELVEIKLSEFLINEKTFADGLRSKRRREEQSSVVGVVPRIVRLH